jgi:acyl-coenzyme A synthetase/AMP-(fatty) acid ligase
MTALDLILTTLRSDPSRPVLEYRGKEITAQAFLGKAQGLAIRLREAGLNHGDTLGVAAADNVTAMQLMVASWMCGAAPLVLDIRQSARNLADWHQRLGLRLIATPGTARMPDLANSFPIPAEVEPLDRLPWVPPSDEELIADYYLSSGTTGAPKVLPVTQGGMARTIERWLRDPALGIVGVTLSALSLAYPGSRTVWYRNLVAGQKIVALDLLHGLHELDAALMRPDVQDCTLPPVLIRRLTQLPPKGLGPRYPQLLKLRAIGGPATPEDKLRTLDHLTPNYLMTYSSTDAGVITRILGPEMRERPSSCGRPVPGVRVEIMEGNRICAPGETGSIRVCRDGQDPVEPGDLGWLDDEGYLYITGRSCGLICRNGLNIGIAEVEEALLACPQIQDAAVWPTLDEDLGDRINALVECAPGDEPAVTAFIRRHLSHRERPDRVVFTRRLPQTPGGKPDRRAIAASFPPEAALPHA